MNNNPLFKPVIICTSRKGRVSENVAKFVCQETSKREGVDTESLDASILEGTDLDGQSAPVRPRVRFDLKIQALL